MTLDLIIHRAPLRLRRTETVWEFHVELRQGARSFRTLYESPKNTPPTLDAVLASVLLTHALDVPFSTWSQRTGCTDVTRYSVHKRMGAAFRVFLGAECFERLLRHFELQPLGSFSPAAYLRRL